MNFYRSPINAELQPLILPIKYVGKTGNLNILIYFILLSVYSQQKVCQCASRLGGGSHTCS